MDVQTMIIGVPKEIKDQEHRVAMTPAGVQGLTARGHQVLIERGAGPAAGMGAGPYLRDVDVARMRSLAALLPPNVTTLMSNPITIEECVKRADVLVGAVLIPGAKAPRLVTREMIKLMKQ